MITISTLRFDGEADDSTTWKFSSAAVFCMLHVVEPRSGFVARCIHGDKHSTAKEKNIYKSDRKKRSVVKRINRSLRVSLVPRTNNVIARSTFLLFFRKLLFPTFTHEHSELCASSFIQQLIRDCSNLFNRCCCCCFAHSPAPVNI